MKLVPYFNGQPASSLRVVNQQTDVYLRGFTDRGLSSEATKGFNLAVAALAHEFYHSGAPSIMKACEPILAVIHCSTFSLSYEFDPENPGLYTFGQYVPFIILRADLWEAYSLTPLQIAAVILEEICHYIYSINDETLVKLHVVRLLNQIQPVNFEQLYYSFPGTPNLH